MALTTGTYIERVRLRAEQMGRVLEVEPIEATLDDALGALATLVERSGQPLLSKDVTVTLTGGVADLTTIVDPMLSSILASGIMRITHDSVGKLSRVRSRSDLDHHRLLGNYCAIADNQIYTRQSDGSSAVADGTLTLQAYYAPVLSAVPPELENDLIEIGLQLASAQQQQQQ